MVIVSCLCIVATASWRSGSRRLSIAERFETDGFLEIQDGYLWISPEELEPTSQILHFVEEHPEAGAWDISAYLPEIFGDQREFLISGHPVRIQKLEFYRLLPQGVEFRELNDQEKKDYWARGHEISGDCATAYPRSHIRVLFDKKFSSISRLFPSSARERLVSDVAREYEVYEKANLDFILSEWNYDSYTKENTRQLIKEGVSIVQNGDDLFFFQFLSGIPGLPHKGYRIRKGSIVREFTFSNEGYDCASL